MYLLDSEGVYCAVPVMIEQLTSLSRSCSPCPLSAKPHPYPSSALSAPKKASSSRTGVCRGAASVYCAYMRAEGEDREESRDITQVRALDPRGGGQGSEQARGGRRGV